MHMHGRLPVQCPRRHAGAASRGNELFVLEGLAGRSCSTADPRMTVAAGLEPPAGIPRPTRSPQLMACRIRREANRQSRAHPPVGRRDRLTHLSATAGAASRSSWRTDRRPGLRLAKSVTFRIQRELATLRL